MTNTVLAPPAEVRRHFGLHPKILLTIIREQAGSLSKALAELVMNSVDARATRIDITISESHFTIADDGHGFTSLDQLENFFEVFGTPHEEGDAYYGRFRIGRGQIMSYARTTWRSGPFEMRVDIAGDATDLGYDLLTHSEVAGGCRIDGEFYEPHTAWNSDYEDCDWGSNDYLSDLIRYIPIPVFINGRQSNRMPSDEQWDHEDDVAWYRFCRERRDPLGIYNQGVLVEYKEAAHLGTGGTIVTKQPLVINMARNALIERNCPTWRHICQVIADRFRSRLAKAKKLDIDERAKLINDLLFGKQEIFPAEACQLRKIRFIPDIFGEVRSPDQFLAGANYTLFDGEHTMIAERAQTQGRAAVVMPEMFYRTGLNTETVSNYGWAIARIRSRLGMDDGFLWVDFAKLVKEMDDTVQILDDKDLTAEELIVLDALRYLNDRDSWRWRAGSSAKRRAVVAGVSDTMDAWTDGETYIAVDRDALRSIRNSGSVQLILLMIHEYGHDESSIGGHAHDFAFYHRFHRFAVTCSTGELADLLFRRYVTGICKAGIVPSSQAGSHVRHLASWSPRLKSRRKAKQIEDVEGVKEVDEARLFEATDRLRARVEDAKAATKATRKAQTRMPELSPKPVVKVDRQVPLPSVTKQENLSPVPVADDIAQKPYGGLFDLPVEPFEAALSR